MRTVLTATAVAVVLFVGGVARADASDQVTAEALFSEGRRLMTAGKLDEACPKFAESQRLDPAPGTLLNLAACYERAGKTASAWNAFREAEVAAGRAGQKDRAAFAKKQWTRLETKLALVTISLASDAATDGLIVRRDGAVVGKGALETPLPVDPGSYEVEATAPGRLKWSSKVQVAPGPSKLVVTIPRLEQEPVIHAAVPVAAVAAQDTQSPLRAVADEAPVDSDRSRGKAQRIAGATAGAVGLVAIGVGAYFGLKARSTYDDAKTACGGTTACPDDTGLRLRDDAGQQATISTVAFIGGAALAAGGAILFFTAPKSARPNQIGLMMSPSGSGATFSMRGNW